MQVHLPRTQVKFVYHGHWVKVVVTRAEKRCDFRMPMDGPGNL